MVVAQLANGNFNRMHSLQSMGSATPRFFFHRYEYGLIVGFFACIQCVERPGTFRRTHRQSKWWKFLWCVCTHNARWFNQLLLFSNHFNSIIMHQRSQFHSMFTFYYGRLHPLSLALFCTHTSAGECDVACRSLGAYSCFLLGHSERAHWACVCVFVLLECCTICGVKMFNPVHCGCSFECFTCNGRTAFLLSLLAKSLSLSLSVHIDSNDRQCRASSNTFSHSFVFQSENDAEL